MKEVDGKGPFCTLVMAVVVVKDVLVIVAFALNIELIKAVRSCKRGRESKDAVAFTHPHTRTHPCNPPGHPPQQAVPLVHPPGLARAWGVLGGRDWLCGGPAAASLDAQQVFARARAAGIEVRLP